MVSYFDVQSYIIRVILSFFSFSLPSSFDYNWYSFPEIWNIFSYFSLISSFWVLIVSYKCFICAFSCSISSHNLLDSSILTYLVCFSMNKFSYRMRISDLRVTPLLSISCNYFYTYPKRAVSCSISLSFFLIVYSSSYWSSVIVLFDFTLSIWNSDLSLVYDYSYYFSYFSFSLNF